MVFQAIYNTERGDDHGRSRVCNLPHEVGTLIILGNDIELKLSYLKHPNAVKVGTLRGRIAIDRRYRYTPPSEVMSTRTDNTKGM